MATPSLELLAKVRALGRRRMPQAEVSEVLGIYADDFDADGERLITEAWLQGWRDRGEEPADVLAERLPDETAKAHAAFVAYCELGPTRSLKQLEAQVGSSLSTLKRWSAQYQWQERCARYDAAITRQRQAAREAEARAWEQSELDFARSLLAEASELVQGTVGWEPGRNTRKEPTWVEYDDGEAVEVTTTTERDKGTQLRNAAMVGEMASSIARRALALPTTHRPAEDAQQPAPEPVEVEARARPHAAAPAREATSWTHSFTRGYYDRIGGNPLAHPDDAEYLNGWAHAVAHEAGRQEAHDGDGDGRTYREVTL